MAIDSDFYHNYYPEALNSEFGNLKREEKSVANFLAKKVTSGIKF